ncbi:MAG: hypothetical protein GF329_11940 [Candidatus Lokiarchaeota archaeon]|nr:hypothetical protein [Candidatus Lokiarchaeota archaeon]
MKILCVGGCVFDILVVSDKLPILNLDNKRYFGIEYGSKIPGSEFIANEGGSATNVALNLNLLGLDSALLATIGDDFLGNYIYNKIKSSGLDTRGIIRVNNSHTGTAFIVKSKELNDRGMITVKGASDLLNKNQIDKEFVKEFDYLVWCSLTSQSAIEAIEGLIDIFKSKGSSKIIAAPSSSIIRKYPKKCLKLVKKSKIYASNLEEASSIIGNEDIDWIQCVKKFLNLGLEFISITKGKEGAIIGNKNKLIKIIPPKISIIDTTGVGDAFLAGVIYGLIEEKTLETTGKLATIMAMCVLKQYGTRKGFPSINKVLNLINELGSKIKIKKVE